MSQKKNKSVAATEATITSSLDSFEAAREWSDNSIRKLKETMLIAAGCADTMGSESLQNIQAPAIDALIDAARANAFFYMETARG